MYILLMNPLNNPKFGYDYMDLGLGYLASCLKKCGHTVQLLLSPKDFSSQRSFTNFIKKNRFDVYGIKVMSTSIIPCRNTVRMIREADPDAVIILGGPHISCDRNNVYNIVPEANYAFYSEAEIGFTEFIKKLSEHNLTDEELQKIPNLIWKKGFNIVINDLRFVENLDELPFPAWELMDPREFSNTSYNGYSRRYPIAPLIQSRGCPFKCTYCAASLMNGYKIRSRSAENVMEEIRLLTQKFSVREIQLFDSNCAHPKGPLREVCRSIISEKINITWNAPVGLRLEYVDEELVDLMKKSGCFQISVGIESASERILKQIKKDLSLDLVREKIKILRMAGIEVLGSFMIGFPGETIQEIKETISFALELPITAACFSILTPFPGAEIYKELFKDKSMDSAELSSLDYINYENDLSELPYSDLRKIQKHAYLRFYIRPQILKHVLKNLNSISKIKFILNRAYLDAFKG